VLPEGATAAPQMEVLNALVTLGYKPAEARRLVDQIPRDAGTTAEMLRAALRSAAAGRS
jgi:Holliday junction resolvasome RuvABC DNA-binding subunit